MEKSSCLAFGARILTPADRGGRPSAGLLRFEPRILETLGPRAMPEPNEAAFPRWPLLRLFSERIFDALAHDELSYGKAGMAQEPQRPALDDPALIVRHVDLKAWMSHYYPVSGLHSCSTASSAELHPSVSVAMLNVLLADREAAKLQLAGQLAQLHAALKAQHEALAKEHASSIREGDASEPGLRSESTYLNIIGGLLTLAVGQVPRGLCLLVLPQHGCGDQCATGPP